MWKGMDTTYRRHGIDLHRPSPNSTFFSCISDVAGGLDVRHKERLIDCAGGLTSYNGQGRAGGAQKNQQREKAAR